MNSDPGSYDSEKIKTMILKIIFYIISALGLYFVYLSFGLGEIYIFLFGVLPCGVAAGILFSVLYMPQFSNFIGFGFLFPRKYLNKAPLVLSPFIGMLNNGNIQQAFDGLEPLVEEYSENPDVVLLFAQASMEIPGKEASGFEAMEEHFESEYREVSQNSIKLLFYYVDKAMELQYTDSLIRILSQEEKQSFYTDTEKKAIRIRLDSVRRLLNVD